MKYPQANITIEGQGWNPYAVAAEGKEAFSARVVEDGHYLRGGDDIPLSEDERKTIAGHVFDKATDFVAKEKAKADEKKRKAEEKVTEQAEPKAEDRGPLGITEDQTGDKGNKKK